MGEKKRAQWSSKLGFILAAAGSAVGLGNIWKFPGKAYEGGGAAYILIYLAIVLFVGIPVMITELSIGRAGHADAVGSFHKLDKRFQWVGYVSVFIPFFIGSYYAHVGGWVLRYVVSYLTEPAAVYRDASAYFTSLLGVNAETGATSFPWTAVLFGAIFMTICAVVLFRGVSEGIEKFNKIGMPALFFLLLVLLVRVVTLDGAGEGLRYMLICDWSQVTFDTFLSTLGQAFFSLSLGMGIIITYGSYISKETDIAKSSIVICCMDTLVALISGFIVIPAVFATLGSDGVGKGAGFAFISLAGVFEQMPVGWLFGALFYLLLLFAALTSCISLIEVVVAYLTEHFHLRRKRITILLCIVMFLFGCLYTCSQAAFDIKGIWVDFANGLTFPTFADFMEFLPDRLLIPLCALGACLFAGWSWKPKAVVEEVRRSGAKFAWAGLYGVLVKYIAPAAIIIILVAGFVTGTALS